MLREYHTIQMTIKFNRIKNFKTTKNKFAFHQVIEDSISDLKPDGNGPLHERITNRKFVFNNLGGINFDCTLQLNFRSLDDDMGKKLVELRRNITKNFQRWGKYKIHITATTVMHNKPYV